MADPGPTLWWGRLPDPEPTVDELERRLPDDERRRAARFRAAVARHRFVLARTMLREVVGGRLEAAPETLVFATGERGKPYLVEPAPRTALHFNFSHSGQVAALALASDEVGVDVEALRRVANADRLARRFYSPAETATVCALEGEVRDRAFLRIWTCKEAYLKATGLGVGMALAEVETEPDPRAPPRLLAVSGDRDKAARWTLLEAEIPGAVCTVAIRGPAGDLDVRRFLPSGLETV